MSIGRFRFLALQATPLRAPFFGTYDLVGCDGEHSGRRGRQTAEARTRATKAMLEQWHVIYINPADLGRAVLGPISARVPIQFSRFTPCVPIISTRRYQQKWYASSSWSGHHQQQAASVLRQPSEATSWLHQWRCAVRPLAVWHRDLITPTSRYASSTATTFCLSSTRHFSSRIGHDWVTQGVQNTMSYNLWPSMSIIRGSVVGHAWTEMWDLGQLCAFG